MKNESAHGFVHCETIAHRCWYTLSHVHGYNDPADGLKLVFVELSLQIGQKGTSLNVLNLMVSSDLRSI